MNQYQTSNGTAGGLLGNAFGTIHYSHSQLGAQQQQYQQIQNTYLDLVNAFKNMIPVTPKYSFLQSLRSEIETWHGDILS